jgi:hypothetical protein
MQFKNCRKWLPLSRGTKEASASRPLWDLLPPKWEEDRSDLNEFKSSLYSPLFGNTPLTAKPSSRAFADPA